VEDTDRDQFVPGMLEGFKRQLPDPDPQETSEWIAALDDVYRIAGRERADFLLRKVLKRARQLRIGLPGLVQSRYINTISPEQEPPFPGDEQMELRVRRIIRWNAALMVLRANHESPGIGGHLSTYASSASLYEVGFNHFFRGKDDGGSATRSSSGPRGAGMYSRAFLEGPASRVAARSLPPRGGARPGALFLSAPAAHAGLLGVPVGVDGPRADLGDLPGALQPLPARARHRRTPPPHGCGRSRRRRDGRVRRRWGASRSPAARGSTT
jgi:hypothetical protein